MPFAHPRAVSGRYARLPVLISAIFLVGALLTLLSATHARAQEGPPNTCPRPAQRSQVPEPEDLHSVDGVLKVELTVRSYAEKDGSVRYCYLLPDGNQAPTLRLNPGDELILHLKNEITAAPESPAVSSAPAHA